MASGGAALVLCGAVLVVVGWLARLRRLPRNPLVGIRTPSTMRNHAAWVESHAAVASELIVAGWVTLATGMLAEMVPSHGSLVAALGTIALVALVLHAAQRAIHVARATPGE